MNFLALSKKILILIIFFQCLQSLADITPFKLCLTGRVVADLPTYGKTFVNAANLSKDESSLGNRVEIKTFFYNNRPLEPVRVYNEMKSDGCSAIIGFEYLSDLLLVEKIAGADKIPIFTSYASTLYSENLPNNIFIFMPTYNFLAKQMFEYLTTHSGKIQNVLIITEVNRDEMNRYKIAYSNLLIQNKIKFDTFDFLEDDDQLDKKLNIFLKGKSYKYVFLLSGAIASAKIANDINNGKIVFIGTENYGSSVDQSFYIRLNNKIINSFFIRNIDFYKMNPSLDRFRTRYMEEFHDKPSLLSAYTYDAANIVLNALKEKGGASIQNILDTNYKGITGASISDGKFFRSTNFVIFSVGKDGYKYEE